MPPTIQDLQDSELADLIRAAAAHEVAASKLRRHIAERLAGAAGQGATVRIVDPADVDPGRPDVVHLVQVTNPSDGTSRTLGAFTTSDMAAAALDTPEGRALRWRFDDFGADQADPRRFISAWPLNTLVISSVDLGEAREDYAERD